MFHIFLLKRTCKFLLSFSSHSLWNIFSSLLPRSQLVHKLCRIAVSVQRSAVHSIVRRCLAVELASWLWLRLRLGHFILTLACLHHNILSPTESLYCEWKVHFNFLLKRQHSLTSESDWLEGKKQKVCKNWTRISRRSRISRISSKQRVSDWLSGSNSEVSVQWLNR